MGSLPRLGSCKPIGYYPNGDVMYAHVAHTREALNRFATNNGFPSVRPGPGSETRT